MLFFWWKLFLFVRWAEWVEPLSDMHISINLTAPECAGIMSKWWVWLRQNKSEIQQIQAVALMNRYCMHELMKWQCYVQVKTFFDFSLLYLSQWGKCCWTAEHRWWQTLEDTSTCNRQELGTAATNPNVFESDLYLNVVKIMNNNSKNFKIQARYSQIMKWSAFGSCA